uniref:G protein-coupled receptor n=1 Tax=Acrobeloides nanus TaxID=290746 RepID=A0A914C774_9BILA
MLEDQPSAIVYTPHSNIWVSMFIIFFSTQALIELGMVVFFNILLIKTIKATSKIVTKKTLTLQLSFYRSALIESLFVFIFVVSPALVPCILAIFNIEDLRVGVIGENMNAVKIRP